MNTLQQHPGFLGTLPPELEVIANDTYVVNQLQNSTIHIKEGVDAQLVAILHEDWEKTINLNFNFEGENSTFTFLAFVIGHENQNFPIETTSNHNVPNTNGYYYLRTALFDQSKVNYRGTLVIKPGAQQTDSYLAHHTLMLSPKARTETEPCLEIEADNVAAGHAATIGRVDEDMLFYLRSRGLSTSEAQQMLIRGFMQADLQKIPNAPLRQLLADEIESKL